MYNSAMAIKKISNDDQLGTRTVEISNGDLQALNKINDEWNFKDIESALRYAVAVLSIAKDKKLFYEKEDGEKVTIEPADSLKREQADDNTSEKSE